MTTAQKLEIAAQNMPAVFDAGKHQAEEVCKMKHFAQVVTGDGSDELRFQLPFTPELLMISCHDPDIRTLANVIATIHVDLGAIGLIAGVITKTNGPADNGVDLGAYSSATPASHTLDTWILREQDGLFCVKPSLNAAVKTAIFGENEPYVVTAVKVQNKTDRERFIELLDRLPEGGTYKIQINKTKKEAAFTEEEWAALIGTKSSYTFVLF